MGLSIRYSCVCDTGKRRSMNQDNYFCAGRIRMLDNDGTVYPLCGESDLDCPRLFGVFDGMGGEECGEIASLIAANTAAEFLPGVDPGNDLIRLCIDANARICSYLRQNSISSMGTTAAMLCFSGSGIALCNVGDSRIYRISGENMAQISVDHISVGEDGKKPPLTQSLGIPPEEMLIEPYAAVGRCIAGDKYLICSDGLTDMVAEEEIFRMMKEENVKDASVSLLSAALENGGRDNVTVIALELAESAETPE